MYSREIFISGLFRAALLACLKQIHSIFDSVSPSGPDLIRFFPFARPLAFSAWLFSLFKTPLSSCSSYTKPCDPPPWLALNSNPAPFFFLPPIKLLELFPSALNTFLAVLSWLRATVARRNLGLFFPPSIFPLFDAIELRRMSHRRSLGSRLCVYDRVSSVFFSSTKEIDWLVVVTTLNADVFLGRKKKFGNSRRDLGSSKEGEGKKRRLLKKMWKTWPHAQAATIQWISVSRGCQCSVHTSSQPV